MGVAGGRDRLADPRAFDYADCLPNNFALGLDRAPRLDPPRPFGRLRNPPFNVAARRDLGFAMRAGHGRSAGRTLLDIDGFEAAPPLRDRPPLAGASGRLGSGSQRPPGLCGSPRPVLQDTPRLVRLELETRWVFEAHSDLESPRDLFPKCATPFVTFSALQAHNRPRCA